MTKDLVEIIKGKLVAKGVDLSGPCGAFQITKRVAWALRAQGFGLLSKSSGNNCDGYAVDIVVDAQGNYYDILGDGGGANNPQWPDTPEAGDKSRWMTPLDPGDDAPPPADPPSNDDEPQLPTCTCKFNEDVLNEIKAALAELRTRQDRDYTAKLFGGTLVLKVKQ